MSNKSVQKALSHVTGSDLRSFSLVHCNIAEKAGKCTTEELDAFHYLCFGKHKMFILDREMKGPQHDGLLVTISYSLVAGVTTHPKHEPELFYITFTGNIPGCPKILYVRTSDYLNVSVEPYNSQSLTPISPTSLSP